MHATTYATEIRNGSPAVSAARDRRTLGWEIALLAAAVALSGAFTLNRLPFIDEFHHVFAARSLLEDGTLNVAPGAAPYTRAWLFTYLVAGSFALFGESFAAARLPALLGAIGLVIAAFLWVRRIGGRLAAWTAALLLAFTPLTLYLSQMARFYTLHALLFWVGTTIVYRLTVAPRLDRRMVLPAAGALACFALAYHFQVTTVVGIGALALWVILARGPAAWRAAHAYPRARALALAAAVLVTAGVAAAAATGALRGFLELFEYADLWAQSRSGNIRFYHWYFGDQWATIWTLLPALAIVALYAHPMAASLCLVVFGVVVGVHSFAAWKEPRYVYYVTPMLFALVGLAAGSVVPALDRRLRALLARWPAFARRPRLIAATSAAALVLTAGFALTGNNAFRFSREFIALEYDHVDAPPDWPAAARELKPVADSAKAIVVSSAGLKALYYFQRLDYGLLATDMLRIGGRSPDFTVSKDYGKPMLGSPDAVRRVIECHPTGLMLIETRHWRRAWAVPPEIADYIARHADSLPLPRPWRLLGFRWAHAPPAPPAAECEALLSGVPAGRGPDGPSSHLEWPPGGPP